jgi:quercetin dioxygenase-like cupin family protein
MMKNVIAQDELPFRGFSRVFEGQKHGDVGISMFLVDSPPGNGPGLHRHPYAEIFMVQDGKATFTVDGETVEAVPGQIVVVQPGQAHAFISSGEGPLRLTAIHANREFVTEWLSHDESRSAWES